MSSVILHNGSVPVSNGRALSNDAFVADVNDITGETDKTPSGVASTLSDINSALGAAITAKGGTVASDSTLSDKAEEVGSIIAPNPLEYATFANSGLFYVASFPGGYTLDLEVNSLREGETNNFFEHMFYGAAVQDDGHASFHISTTKSIPRLYGVFQEFSAKDSEVYLDFDMSQVNNYINFSFRSKNLYLRGNPIDFSSVTEVGAYKGAYGAFSLSGVKHAEFVPNSLKVTGNFFDNWTDLDNETLVSLANCLNETVQDTIRLASSVVSRASGIYGATSIDPSGEYHIFIVDDNGYTTLADFITQTKGWTLTSA